MSIPPCPGGISPRAPLLLLALALVAACSPPPPEAAPPEAVVPVEVVTATSTTVTDRVVVSGTIAANRQVDLAAEGTGRVIALKVRLGDEVRKGQLLARLDARVARAQLKQAEASLRAAQARLAGAASSSERAERLASEGATSTSQRDLARVELEAATAQVDGGKAAVALAKGVLANCRILAPWAGTIAAVHLEVGSLVAPGQPSFRLVDMNTVRAKAGVPASEVGRLAAEQAATLHIGGLLPSSFDGQLTHVGPEADARTHTYPIEVEVPNDDGTLRAGMVARLEIAVEERISSVVIPDSALVLGDKPHVFVVEGETAQLRLVELGLRSGGQLEVLAGVREGESVVTLGRQHLSDGTRVRRYTMGESGETAPTSSGD